MRRTCAFMQPSPEGWGPKWTTNMTPSQYVTALQVHVMDQSLRLQNEYDDKQQSKEMLYRAALNYNQPIATKLSNELSILLNTSATLPEE
mgnify:FL=1